MRQRMVLATSAVAMVMFAGACGPGGSQQAGDDSSSSSSAPSSATTSGSPTEEPNASPSKKPTQRPPGRIAAKCDAEHVRPRIESSDSAAGSRYAWLVLTNRSKTTCTVYGYGGMQLFDDDGGKVPTKLVRDRGSSPVTLSVRPGGSVRSLLKWSAVPHEGDKQGGSCQPQASVARVTPPDETHNLGTKWSFGPVCDSGRIVQQPYQGNKVKPGE